MARIYRTYALKRNFLQRHASDPVPEKPKKPRKNDKSKKKVKEKTTVASPALGPLGTRKKKIDYRPFAIVGMGLVLLVAAGFIQAAMAASSMMEITDRNYRELKSTVSKTTGTVQDMNIDDPREAAAALESITELSSVASQKADTCKTAAKPTIKSFARDYDRIYEECQASAAASRAVMEASNAVIPVATYQVSLHQALKPVMDLQRSEDKADIKKTQEAWKNTRDNLRKLSAPAKLTDINGRIITITGEIIESLDAVVGEVSPSYGQLVTAESELSDNYKKLNLEGANIEAQLAELQKQLSAAALKLK